jgi:hypothetical protein
MEGGKLPARSASGKPSVYGYQQIDVAHLGGQAAVPITFALAVPLLDALVSVGTDHSSAAIVYGCSLKSETMDLGHGSSGCRSTRTR